MKISEACTHPFTYYVLLTSNMCDVQDFIWEETCNCCIVACQSNPFYYKDIRTWPTSRRSPHVNQSESLRHVGNRTPPPSIYLRLQLHGSSSSHETLSLNPINMCSTVIVNMANKAIIYIYNFLKLTKTPLKTHNFIHVKIKTFLLHKFNKIRIKFDLKRYPTSTTSMMLHVTPTDFQ